MSKTNKITELTKEQEAQMAVYRDKWICIGQDTRRADREKVESLVPAIYAQKDLKAPEVILWADSPWQAIDIITERYDINTSECFYNFCYGQHDANWLGFYQYFFDVVGLAQECKPALPLISLAQEVGWFLPFAEVICFSERPEEINLLTENGIHHCIKNEKPAKPVVRGVLHKDNGMAIRFRDGKGQYKLNGITVPEEIVMTPWDKIDPNLVLTTTNADVRREIVRKIGVERMSTTLGATVMDKQGDYELLSLKLNDGRVRPYLKMMNPSLGGVWHIEGVPPNIKSVKEAIIWRNETDEEPIVLT